MDSGYAKLPVGKWTPVSNELELMQDSGIPVTVYMRKPHKIIRVSTRAELVEVQEILGVRTNWHEPDEQDVTATTRGVTFDNAGFWPDEDVSDTMRTHGEQYVTLYKEGVPIAHVNLALLFAWATGYRDE